MKFCDMCLEKGGIRNGKQKTGWRWSGSKRKDRRWEGRIVVGHKANGTPIFRSVFAKTQKMLMEKLHQHIEIYRDVELSEDCDIPLGEWLDRWKENYAAYAVRPNTLSSYESMIENYIKPRLGMMRISDITTEDIQQMYNRLKEMVGSMSMIPWDINLRIVPFGESI